jgi:hypothetical protein
MARCRPPPIDGGHFGTRCRQDGNHLASFGCNCVRKSHINIDITLDIVIITKFTNTLELRYQMLRKLYGGRRYDYRPF